MKGTKSKEMKTLLPRSFNGDGSLLLSFFIGYFIERERQFIRRKNYRFDYKHWGKYRRLFNL